MFTKENASKFGTQGGFKKRGRLATHTLKAQEVRRRMVERFYDEADEWYDALRAAGLGHYVEVITPSGKRVVYKKSPNVLAIKEMYERAYGKVPQTIEIETHERPSLSALAVELLEPYVDDATFINLRRVAASSIESPEDGRSGSVGPRVTRWKRKPAHIRTVLLLPHYPNGSATSAS